MWSRFSEQLLKDICDGKYKRKDLNLSEQEINPDFIPELVDALNSNSKIKSLYLSATGLDDKSVRQLAKCKHIKKMYLEDNEIGNGGAIALASANRLKKLHLSLNLIGDLGAKHLAECRSLVELDVSENGITDKGAQYFLYDNNLNCLYITGNKDIKESTYNKLRSVYIVSDIEEEHSKSEIDMPAIYRDQKVRTLFQPAPAAAPTEKKQEINPLPKPL
ncbi:MAG: hypothetical protein ACYCQI_09885 [Gammaproteobacteria bacterium]